MRFNINDHVRVRLTPYGRRVLEQNHEEFYRSIGIDRPYSPPREDASGWSEWQFWSLMSAFGRNVFAGNEVPFETEIEIRDELLVDKPSGLQFIPPPTPKRRISL